MVHIYWDFESNEKLKKLDPLKRVELAQVLSKKLKVPISSHIAGFENTYIEVVGDDPVQYSPAWKDGMIMRAGFIRRVAVRHLTYKPIKYHNKVQKIAEKVLLA